MTIESNSRTGATTRTALALLAGALLLPALLTACSAEPDHGAASDGPAAPGGTALASCMRDQGYDMEDPSSGQLSLSPPDGVDADQWREALVSCSGSGSAGAGDGQAAQPMPGMDGMARALGECVRDAGYDDYPDEAEEQAAYTPSGDTATFESVQQTCSDEAYATVQGAAG